MGQRIIDLSVTIEDNMPAHKLFQSPIYLTALNHESTKSFNLGVPDDPMTFQTNFIGMLDHGRNACGRVPARQSQRCDH